MEEPVVKHIRRAARINAIFGYLPYDWSKATGTVKFDSSPKKRIRFWFQIVLYWCYVVFLFARAIYVTFVNQKSMTTSKRIVLQYLTVSHCSPVPFQLCSLIMCGRHHVVVNRYLRFHHDVKSEWLNSGCSL